MNQVDEIGKIVFSQNWLEILKKRKIAAKYLTLKDKLTTVQEKGIKYCVDERPIKRILANNQIKPIGSYRQKGALPGGSLFWFVLFRMLGVKSSWAFRLTQKLHQEMGWGQMEIHIDDHHGSLEEVLNHGQKVLGCGFLGVSQQVAKLNQKIFENKIPLKELDDLALPEIINWFYRGGARIIELTGAHKADQAAYIINIKPGTTLNQPELYNSSTPAFVTDLWLIREKNEAGLEVAATINKLLEKKVLTTDNLERLTLTMTLLTAALLSAYRVDNILLIN